MPKEISQKYLREAIEYNPLSGVFIWRNRPLSHFSSRKVYKWWASTWAGKKAGCLYSSGGTVKYMSIRLDGWLYAAHRLAWIYMNGDIPTSLQIDHIDGNGTNNKIENLRVVTHIENHMNLPRNKNNTSGVTGVRWNNPTQKWRARISVRGKEIPLGCYGDLSDALNARKQADLKYGFHANHGRG